MVINRPEYIERLTSKTGNGLIKVITGIRRCGKSYLLFNLFRDYLLSQGIEEECIIDIPLDDDDYIELRNPDNLKSYITQRIDNPRKLYYILIDEAQFAISSEEMKNKDMPIRLYGILSGLLRKGNAEVYITGSNSKFLSKDIRTEFRDRSDVIHISPLSFSEYYHASSLDKNDAWREYIYFGGLPHLLLEKNDSGKMNYLKGLNEKIYLADLKERYNLKDDFKITRHFVRLGNSQVVFVPFVPVSQKIEDEMINHASYGISPNAEKRSDADNYAAVYKTSESIADIEEKFINRVRGYDIRMIVLMDYLFWGPGDIIQYDCLMNRWSGCQNVKYVFGASSYDDLNTLSNSKFLEYQLARPVIGSNAHFYNVFNPKTRYQFLFDYMNFENRGVLVLPESETEFAQKMFFKSSPFVLQL